MSNIFNDPSNDAAIQAIGDAIESAAGKICQEIDPKEFNPRAETYILRESPHDFCNRFFHDEIEGMNFEIIEYQDVPDLISYAGTRGWLYGYICAEDQVSQTTPNQNDKKSNQYDENKKSSSEQSNDQKNSTGKTEEAAKSKSDPDGKTDESEGPESTDKEELLQKLRGSIGWPLVIGIAIGAGIAIIACVIIDWLM